MSGGHKISQLQKRGWYFAAEKNYNHNIIPDSLGAAQPNSIYLFLVWVCEGVAHWRIFGSIPYRLGSFPVCYRTVDLRSHRSLEDIPVSEMSRVPSKQYGKKAVCLSSIYITIFQAPWACLLDCGLLVEMHLHPKLWEPIPAQYYLPVFRGSLEMPDGETPALEYVAQTFGPGGPSARNLPRQLSIGDVVRLERKHYLLAPEGFQEVIFEITEGEAAPRPDRREEFGEYLRAKYAIHGKAGIFLENILEYCEGQSWSVEKELEFLEEMLRGLGIRDEDRELFAGGDDPSVW